MGIKVTDTAGITATAHQVENTLPHYNGAEQRTFEVRNSRGEKIGTVLAHLDAYGDTMWTAKGRTSFTLTQAVRLLADLGAAIVRVEDWTPPVDEPAAEAPVEQVAVRDLAVGDSVRYQPDTDHNGWVLPYSPEHPGVVAQVASVEPFVYRAGPKVGQFAYRPKTRGGEQEHTLTLSSGAIYGVTMSDLWDLA